MTRLTLLREKGDVMKIAVDFDGTIVDHRYPEIGDEVPGATHWIREFQKAGAKVMLWTMRSDGGKDGPVLSHAVNWCFERGVVFDKVNHDSGQESWTKSPKLYANLYIDDAAFGCPLRENPRCGGRPYVDWSVVGPAVLQLLQSKR